VRETLLYGIFSSRCPVIADTSTEIMKAKVVCADLRPRAIEGGSDGMTCNA